MSQEQYIALAICSLVTFVVKSTSPSFVGGDTWGSIGPKPEYLGSNADAEVLTTYIRMVTLRSL